MTKTCAKPWGRETLKDGIVSKFQRRIVSQHLISSRFMTNDNWTLLCYRLIFARVSEPRGPLLVEFYMFRTLCHNLTTINQLLMKFTLSLLIIISGEKFYLQISTRKDHTFKNDSAHHGKRNDFENPIHDNQ